MKQRILLLGKNGQIGWELQRTLAPLGEVVALGRPELDLTEFDRLREAVREVRPEIIVNAAAYTDVDRAESEPELAMAVNGRAPGVLAEEAARLGAVLVHFSTDYVFDGAKGKPYSEQDAPNPLNVYGETKLAGERAVEAAGAAHLILRTSWVYSLRRECFVTRVLRWAREQSIIEIAADQVSTPTWCRTIGETAAAILTLATRDLREFGEHNSGLYHLAASGQASRYEWAQAILSEFPGDQSRGAVQLVPSKSHEFSSPARRPPYSALDCTRLCERFSVQLPHWRIGLSLASSDGAAI